MAPLVMPVTCLFISRRVLVEEMMDQQRDVLLALAQRRELELDDVEPEKQVFAEFALRRPSSPDPGWRRR